MDINPPWITVKRDCKERGTAVVANGWRHGMITTRQLNQGLRVPDSKLWRVADDTGPLIKINIGMVSVVEPLKQADSLRSETCHF